MISEGDIILFRFPRTDLASGKLRPALLLKKIPHKYSDWLVCMISTQGADRWGQADMCNFSPNRFT